MGSGPGEGLEAWRRLHKRWGPLTTGRARGLLREILPLGRAKLGELQGAVERLDVKISSQRTRATLPTPTVTVGHVSETERRSRLPHGSKRIRCTQTGSSCEGSSGQRRPYGCWRVRTKGRPTSRGKGKNPTLPPFAQTRSQWQLRHGLVDVRSNVITLFLRRHFRSPLIFRSPQDSGGLFPADIDLNLIENQSVVRDRCQSRHITVPMLSLAGTSEHATPNPWSSASFVTQPGLRTSCLDSWIKMMSTFSHGSEEKHP